MLFLSTNNYTILLGNFSYQLFNKPFHIEDFADGKFDDFPSNRVRLECNTFFNSNSSEPNGLGNFIFGSLGSI